MATMPGGFWYPERPDGLVLPPTVVVAPGDAVGNRVALPPVTSAGAAVYVSLTGPVDIALLDLADAVLRSRSWVAGWDPIGAAAALSVEWTSPIDLTDPLGYRLALIATGGGAITVYDQPLDASIPAAYGSKTSRVGGVWTDDPTRRVYAALRLTGL